MAAGLFKAPTVNYKTTSLNGAIDDSATTITLTSTTNLQAPGYVVIDREDGSNTATPSSREVVKYTGISSNDLTGCTRGADGSTARSHSDGALVETMFTVGMHNDQYDMLTAEHNTDGTHSDITVNIVSAATVTADRINLNGATDNITVNETDPRRTITLPASSWFPTTTSGAAAATKVEAGTNDIDYYAMDFDPDSDENAFCNIAMPDSWDAGVVQFRYFWSNASGAAAETVTFELSGLSLADNDAIDTAVGTPVEVADTWLAIGDMHISAWSGDVTLAGTPAAGEFAHFELMRDVSEDDLTGDARLLAVQIRYKQDQFGD